MDRIRQAAVAGSFYPADSDELRTVVHGLLDSIPAHAGPAPRALIVPHAGLVYSGSVAATAYARLRPLRQKFRRVLLLGPCHRMAFRGMAVSGADCFRTPLGDVPLDHAAIASISHPDLAVADAPHRAEHSLEVQLPFLQCVLDSFTLVPIAVGDANPDSVADVIDAYWDDPETLVVVSSDLSHYLDYRAAQRRDDATCNAIELLKDMRIGYADACGATPVRGLLKFAKRRGMRAVTLDLRNSGDTAGPREQVVGYGAWIFVEEGAWHRAA
jgi:AmmeMemoRadiSam system protein B